jgi:hypothetical protein
MRFMSVDEAVERIRAEYLEMPDLALTQWQAQRLWNLSQDLCDRALLTLLRSKFLVRTAGGTYLRREASPEGPPITVARAS